MIRQKALFRFRDGLVESGWFVGELPLPSRAQSVTFEPDAGESRTVELANLKAIFLLRPWESGASLASPEGVRVTIEFFDGEQVRGLASGWGPGNGSFILIPEDQSRIEAIVVVSAALSSVEVESP